MRSFRVTRIALIGALVAGSLAIGAPAQGAVPLATKCTGSSTYLQVKYQVCEDYYGEQNWGRYMKITNTSSSTVVVKYRVDKVRNGVEYVDWYLDSKTLAAKASFETRKFMDKCDLGAWYQGVGRIKVYEIESPSLYGWTFQCH